MVTACRLRRPNEAGSEGKRGKPALVCARAARPRRAGLVDAGELRAEVDSVFLLTEARAACERVAARGKRGKVVLEVGTD